MGTNSLSTPSMISDPRRNLNFTKAGKPRLNASNQPAPKKPSGKGKKK